MIPMHNIFTLCLPTYLIQFYVMAHQTKQRVNSFCSKKLNQIPTYILENMQTAKFVSKNLSSLHILLQRIMNYYYINTHVMVFKFYLRANNDIHYVNFTCRRFALTKIAFKSISAIFCSNICTITSTSHINNCALLMSFIAEIILYMQAKCGGKYLPTLNRTIVK